MAARVGTEKIQTPKEAANGFK